MTKRRELLIAIGAGALAAPLVSFAQQQIKVWRVGFLSQRQVDFLESDYYYGPFRQGMRELGYVEGKNLVIEWRFADGKIERLSRLATELVTLNVDVIVAGGTPATKAAQKATATIPIVMGSVGDPVGAGLVKSLARPGGNITGLSNSNLDISSKRLEMLISIVPELSRVAVLVNPDNPNGLLLLKQVQATAKKTSIMVMPADARTQQEIENAFSMMAREKVGAVIVQQDASFVQQQRQIAELAAKNRVPSIAGYRQYAEAGGLISYGQSLADNYRRTAAFVDKIFKGAQPGDLPVEQPMTLELIINLKAAKAIGLTIPQELRFRADSVIE